MLYSGHGLTLPCFVKGKYKLNYYVNINALLLGEKAISELKERFNPKNVQNDGDLSVHCNNLIN